MAHSRLAGAVVTLAAITAFTATLGATGAAAGTLPGTLPGTSAPDSAIPLPGTVAGFVSHARDVGSTPAKSVITFDVVLDMRDRAAADALLQQVSTPGSGSYGRWLTTAQFRDRFGATDAQVRAVEGWLRDRGLVPGRVAQGRMSLSVTGTAERIDAAFGTQLRQYSYDGKTLRANATTLKIPRNLSGIVTGVVHLDQSSVLKTPTLARPDLGGEVPGRPAAQPERLPGPPPGVRYGVQPCSAYYGQKIAKGRPKAYGKHWPYTVCGYTPVQFASAYGVAGQWKAGRTGQGVTVAITDAYASPTILKDANIYAQRHGQQPFARGQFQQLLAPSFDHEELCDPQGWYGEETLDVEAVHGMAPGATVLYVGGANCGPGLDDAWATVIDDHLADIVTNSWSDLGESLPPAMLKFYDQYSMQAALTGITDIFSSGDSGDNTTLTKRPTVNVPASLPYVTAVGGTSIGIGKSGNYLFETGWSTAYATLQRGAWRPKLPGTFSSGSGGGTSRVFAQPFYQHGKVPVALSERYGPQPARVVPDISMAADSNTGMRIGQTQRFPHSTYYSEYRIGGTSLAAPLLAGVIAVADSGHGRPLGFVNPSLYQLLGTPALHDIVPPTWAHKAQVRTDFVNLLNRQGGRLYRLDTLDVPTTITAQVGYDDQTGVGTPNGAAFFLSLAGLAVS